MSRSQPSAVASSRPTWATSRVWVSRLRMKSLLAGPTTCVLPASLRNAAECTIRALSRWYGDLPDRLGSSTKRSASASSYPSITEQT